MSGGRHIEPCIHKGKTNGRLIGAYTTKEHLILDLDNCSEYKAVRLATMIQQQYPLVGNCLLLQSSKQGFHLVYSSRISWKYLTRIVETLAGLEILNSDYVRIREFRHDLSLRITEVDRGEGLEDKPRPIVLLENRVCSLDNLGIEEYCCLCGIDLTKLRKIVVEPTTLSLFLLKL